MIALSKKITLGALLIGGLTIPTLEMIGAEKRGIKDRVKGFFSRKKDEPQPTNNHVDDATICPVCQEEWGTTDDGIEVKKTILKPCNHALCELCATDWLKNNDTCPVCQQKVEVSVMSKIRSKFNSLKKNIEKKFSNAKAMVQDKWANAKEKVKSKWQGVKQKTKSAFSRSE